MEETKKVVKESKVAKIVEVKSTTGYSIELEDGTMVDELELQVRIYNKLSKIENSVA
jgi:DNA-binding XRE family transcriptional regulator